MKWSQNVSLSGYNTLACPSSAQYLAECYTLSDLRETFAFARANKLRVTVLGGGSNVIMPVQMSGIVLLNRLPGVAFKPLPDGQVLLQAGAGEVWDNLVRLSVQRGLRGIENLILIPGRVGAAPIQNIGAYGAELSDTLLSVEIYDPASDDCRTLSLADCQLGYRDSIFKTAVGREWVITGITLTLSPNRPLVLEYADLRQRWEQEEGAQNHPQAVARVVERLRRAKLPDPADIPNAGSFFKNPVVDHDVVAQLRLGYPELVAYPVLASDPALASDPPIQTPPERLKWKLAAGWLIDKAGWKGRMDNGVGCHERQALVLVNPGHRSADEVLAFATRLQADVKARFGVDLEPEPVLLGETETK